MSVRSLHSGVFQNGVRIGLMKRQVLSAGKDFRRKANPCDVRCAIYDLQNRPMFADLLHTGRGKPRSPARQAGPTTVPLGKRDLQQIPARQAGPT